MASISLEEAEAIRPWYRLCKVSLRNEYTKSDKKQIHVNVMNKQLSNFWLL